MMDLSYHYNASRWSVATTDAPLHSATSVSSWLLFRRQSAVSMSFEDIQEVFASSYLSHLDSYLESHLKLLLLLSHSKLMSSYSDGSFYQSCIHM